MQVFALWAVSLHLHVLPACLSGDDAACVGRITGHTGSVNAIDYSPSGTRLITGSSDNSIRAWSTSTGGVAQYYAGHVASVLAVRYSPDGATVASGSSDRNLKIWRVSDATVKQTVAVGSTVHSVAFSSGGTQIVTGDAGNAVRVWTSSGAVAYVLSGHSSAVRGAEFSPDDTRIVSCGGTDVIVWNVASKSVEFTLTGHTDEVMTVAYSPDGKKVASGGRDDTVIIWDLATQKAEATFLGHTGVVYSIAYSTNGAYIVSGGAGDNNVKMWVPDSSLSLILDMKGHTSAVYSVRFSKNVRFIASASVDLSERVWKNPNTMAPFAMTVAPDTDPPVTDPPATDPPATDPPATDPPDTDPPATDPPATDPPATDPPATDPPDTDPPATDPPATDPPATDPPATDPPATDPPATDPPDTDPPATDPPATDAPKTEAPETALPSTLTPGNTHPPPTPAPDTAIPETLPPQTPAPDTAVPSTLTPGHTRPPATPAPKTAAPTTAPTTTPLQTAPPDTPAPTLTTLTPQPLLSQPDDGSAVLEEYTEWTTTATATGVTGGALATTVVTGGAFTMTSHGLSRVARAQMYLRMLECPRDTATPMPFVLSPSQLRIGRDTLREERGAAIGNTVIITMLILTTCLGALVHSSVYGTSGVLASLREMPVPVVCLVLELLWTPIMQGATALVLHGSHADLGVGMGILLLSAGVIAWLLWLANRARKTYVTAAVPATRWLDRYVAARWEWREQTPTHALRASACVFDGYRFEHSEYFAIQLIFTGSIGVLFGWNPQTLVNCAGRAGLITCMPLIWTAIVLKDKPFSRWVENWVEVLLGLLEFAFAVVAFLGVSQENEALMDAGENIGEWVGNAAVLKFLLDIWLYCRERWYAEVDRKTKVNRMPPDPHAVSFTHPEPPPMQEDLMALLCEARAEVEKYKRIVSAQAAELVESRRTVADTQLVLEDARKFNPHDFVYL